MRDEIRVTRERNGAGEKLRVSGELDIGTAPDLERAVASAVDGHRGQFRLDISGLTFIDPTGGQALLHMHNSIEARGGRAVFEHPQAEVLNVLRLLGLEQVLDIRP
jgi:anti-sigma B factor antagonist